VKYKYDKIVIGFDQSYTNTGISIAADGNLLIVKSTNYYKGIGETKTDKRNYIRKLVKEILEKNVHKAKKVVIHVERIRTFSQGKNGSQGYGLKPGYIKMTGALLACIIDEAKAFGVKVYSVDTRSWKSQVVGTSKNETEDKKLETYEFVKELGFDTSFKNTRGTVKYDDDASDSACIALYGFLPRSKQKLLLEE
jgi:hypothetical protein